MNAVFGVVFVCACAGFLLFDAEGFLPAMLKGGEKAATLTLALLSSYCVWLGFFKVMEKCGLQQKLSAALFPLSKRLFRSNDREALSVACCNLSANFLGLPGAPTPLGVKATERFCSAQNFYAADMLFVLNATSLQLLPTTAIALRAAAGSVSPADIFLPTLLSTLFGTALGAFLVFLTARKPSHPKRSPLKLRRKKRLKENS